MDTFKELEFKDETFTIVGAAMEVHSILGNGFLEAVYHEALCIEFERRNIPYIHEEPLSIKYKNVVLKRKYVPDFFCFNGIIVEVKASSNLTSDDMGQVINYLKATGCTLAILLNFGSKSLMYKRVVMSHNKT
ncbi:MAG TPA: GxxExxY protein [Bacteroidales bacterium]|nr:GxxExxY protein [Bacteroidales bacterium]